MTAEDTLDRTRRAAEVGYAAVAVADVTLAALEKNRARRLTKPALMPLLAVGRDRRTQRALGLSWAGDVALLGTSPGAFTAGLGSFLGAQVAWIAALRQRPGGGLLRRRPWLAAPHVVAGVGLTAYLWPRAGKDRLPVAVYSAALTSMALTALDSGRPATAGGGTLFMASDSLIALDRFAGLHLPGHEGWVMATYTAAQWLLASSVEPAA